MIAVGTGKALRMGRDGDVDVVLVHAPAAEQKFVDEGYGEQRLPVMFNDFVIVGPRSDPAGLSRAGSAADALGPDRRQRAACSSRAGMTRVRTRRNAHSGAGRDRSRAAAGTARPARAWARSCRWPTNCAPTP